MKVFTIEIASAIEKTFLDFLKDWGGSSRVRFTRFIDLGGKQTDLFMYPPPETSQPWMIARIKSVYKSDQGECMQYFVELPTLGKNMDDVLVSPEIWKLPAVADKILDFAKQDFMVWLSEEGNALEEGDSGSLPEASSSDNDEEDLDDLDTSGILAGDGDGAESDFDPGAMIRAANLESGDDSQK